MSRSQFLPPLIVLQKAASDGSIQGMPDNQFTRRSFIKRTGGATVATFLVWHGATMRSDAAGVDSNSSSSHKSSEKTYIKRSDASDPVDGDTPSADGTITVYEVKHKGSANEERVQILNTNPNWEFKISAFVPAQSQGARVKMDCMQCEVKDVELSLANAGLPSGVSVDAISGPAFKRGITVQVSSDGNKVNHSGPTGSENKSVHNIAVKMAAVVSPTEDASSKTVTWTVTPTSSVEVGSLEDGLKADLKNHYENAPGNNNKVFEISVNLPNPDLGGDVIISEKVSTATTKDDVSDGTGCQA